MIYLLIIFIGILIYFIFKKNKQNCILFGILVLILLFGCLLTVNNLLINYSYLDKIEYYTVMYEEHQNDLFSKINPIYDNAYDEIINNPKLLYEFNTSESAYYCTYYYKLIQTELYNKGVFERNRTLLIGW